MSKWKLALATFTNEFTVKLSLNTGITGVTVLVTGAAVGDLLQEVLS